MSENSIESLCNSDDSQESSFRHIVDVASEARWTFLNSKDTLVAAWLAETGFLPSESVLVHSQTIEDEKIVFRCWVERKK